MDQVDFRVRFDRLLVALCACVAVVICHAGNDPWKDAARTAGVPVVVLHAIAITESGKTWSDGVKRPWPWTLNSVKGPMFFASREQAAAALRQILAEGITNVDIGLMQVNYGYHHHRVANPADLLDPQINLRVAAAVLREARKVVGGDVAAAVGAYHAGFAPSKASRAAWYQNTVASFARRLRPQRAVS